MSCTECPYFGEECLPDDDGDCLLDEDENSIMFSNWSFNQDVFGKEE
jgi:hypothetical protein